MSTQAIQITIKDVLLVPQKNGNINLKISWTKTILQEKVTQYITKA